MVVGVYSSYLRRCVLLLSLVCVIATGATSEKKKTPWYCSRVVLIAAGMTAVLGLGPGIVHSTGSVLSKNDHIGHGIYMDTDRVLEKLSSEERDKIEDPEVSIQEKVQIFTTRLEGNYGNWVFSPIALPSRASDYLDPSNPDRGVCRQKACVLNSILHHLKINSILQSGTHSATPHRWHVWVYLPDLDMVADPTSGEMMPAKQYYQSYNIRLNGVPLPFGWY